MQKFTVYLHTKGAKSFENKRKSKNPYFKNADKNKQEWYDATCKQKRDTVRQASFKYKTHKSEEIRK